MNFREWMLTQRLKIRSIDHYCGVIYRNSVNSLLRSAGRPALYQAATSDEAENLLDFLLQNPDFIRKDEKGNRMYSSGIRKYLSYLQSVETQDAEIEDLREIETAPNLTESERKYLVSCRLCQGKYRQKLLDFWNGKCAVTSVTEEQMLIASHIKPWRLANNEEKISPANGLPLIPQLDRAFDKGLITFDDVDGKIIISPYFTEYEQTGIFGDMRLRDVPYQIRPFLVFHRENLYLKDFDNRRSSRSS